MTIVLIHFRLERELVQLVLEILHLSLLQLLPMTRLCELILRVAILCQQSRRMINLWHERVFWVLQLRRPLGLVVDSHIGKMLLHLDEQITGLVDLWLESALLLFIIDLTHLVDILAFSGCEVLLSVQKV